MKWFVSIYCLMARNGRMLEIFQWIFQKFLTVKHFTDQNWISKNFYCTRCVMVCKICCKNWNAKIALLCASMVVAYYIKLFQTGADRHNSILMSLLLQSAGTITAIIHLELYKYRVITVLLTSFVSKSKLKHCDVFKKVIIMAIRNTCMNFML